ncbi:MAG TPA: TMEM175 family protein [Devosia sp.]|nr:TMEM175 family protein [Devosia sp.]
MGKGRVEAFSDGVMAIIITVMVLELHAPHSPDFEALLEVAPEFLAYVLSFVYIAIYWNNHHHMFQVVRRVDGGVLWANNALLFFLSLVPFTTDWMGENHFVAAPVALYGASLLLPAIGYSVLQARIIHVEGQQSGLAQALGTDWKGKLSPALYLLGIVLAFFLPAVSEGLYVLVALIWLIPDRRIERWLAKRESEGKEASPASE